MPGAPTPKSASYWKKARLVGYLFIAPNVVLFFLLTVFPVLFSFLLAFFHWGGKRLEFSDFRWAGLSNFAELLGATEFWYYLYNTLFLMLAIPVTILINLFVAMLMSNKLREITLYRGIWFLPSVAGGVATLLLWKWIFEPTGGLFNTLLGYLGIQGPEWLQDPSWAKPAFIIMGWWGSAGGFGMLLYLAALQNIPPELYEAAAIDGAGWWARFRHVTWPMVSPTTFFLLITGIIGGFQAGFMNAYVMTRGGPAGATTTLSYYIYGQAYENFRMGYASAVAWTVFLFVAAFTVLNWKLSERLVHYE